MCMSKSSLAKGYKKVNLQYGYGRQVFAGQS